MQTTPIQETVPPTIMPIKPFQVYSYRPDPQIVEITKRVLPINPPKKRKKKADVVPSIQCLYKNLMNKVSEPKHNEARTSIIVIINHIYI